MRMSSAKHVLRLRRPDVVEFMELESLRRPDTPGHQDLREWRFKDKWRHDNDSTVVAWANNHECVLHEAQCSNLAKVVPTAKGTMGDARALFAGEQPKGDVRYFGFCGLCLTERIPNFGWQPTARDVQLLADLRQLLNDMRLLEEKPIKAKEMIARLRRYRGGTVAPKEFTRLLRFYQDSVGDGDLDLSDLVEPR